MKNVHLDFFYSALTLRVRSTRRASEQVPMRWVEDVLFALFFGAVILTMLVGAEECCFEQEYGWWPARFNEHPYAAMEDEHPSKECPPCENDEGCSMERCPLPGITQVQRQLDDLESKVDVLKQQNMEVMLRKLSNKIDTISKWTQCVSKCNNPESVPTDRGLRWCISTCTYQ